MADPYILGISGGAAIGVAIAVLLGSFFNGIDLVFVFSFVFSLLAVYLIYLFSRISRRISPETLILVGVSISTFAAGFLAVIFAFSNNWQNIYFYLLGSLAYANWQSLFTLLPFFVVGIPLTFLFWKDLNAFLFGFESAKSIGVDVKKKMYLLIFISSMLTAVTVSICGLIGFVGLISPHIVRIFLGQNHKYLIPFSAILGGQFLLFSDILSRGLLPPVELPIGAITAFVGAPFFIYLLLRRNYYG